MATSSGTKSDDTQRLTAAAPVSSETLDLAYHNNVFAADQTYKDKMVIAEGPIQEIGKSTDGYPYVLLYGCDEGRTVLCAFSPDAEDTLTQLAVGHRAQIIGVCVGVQAGDVALGSCVLPKQSPVSVVPKDAKADLLKAESEMQ